jgi:glycosyltransferase involved in cell wall biosynthesis
MPRVLLLCEYASLNGGENSLLSLVERGDRQAFEFVAAAPPVGPLVAEFHARAIPVEPFGEASGPKPSQARRREQLAALLARVRPDLLHANSLSMSRLSGPVADAVGISSLGHLRDIVRLSRRAIDDVNRHRRLLAVSRATRDFHVAAGLSEAKCCVVYSGVDLDAFHPGRATGFLHRELSLPPSASLVGFIGQLGMRKGVDVLLEAASRVVETLPSAHFVVVGRRHSAKQEAIDYERQLHQSAQSSRLAGRVHFLGERRDVPLLLREFSVLAHAARQEPLGRVLLEAAASGTAVVATEAGGTREIFPHPGQGRIVPVEDAPALADSLVELLSDDELRHSLARAARKRAETAFDAAKAAKHLFNHYLQG